MQLTLNWCGQRSKFSKDKRGLPQKKLIV